MLRTLVALSLPEDAVNVSNGAGMLQMLVTLPYPRMLKTLISNGAKPDDVTNVSNGAIPENAESVSNGAVPEDAEEDSEGQGAVVGTQVVSNARCFVLSQWTAAWLQVCSGNPQR